MHLLCQTLTASCCCGRNRSSLGVHPGTKSSSGLPGQPVNENIWIRALEWRSRAWVLTCERWCESQPWKGRSAAPSLHRCREPDVLVCVLHMWAAVPADICVSVYLSAFLLMSDVGEWTCVPLAFLSGSRRPRRQRYLPDDAGSHSPLEVCFQRLAIARAGTRLFLMCPANMCAGNNNGSVNSGPALRMLCRCAATLLWRLQPTGELPDAVMSSSGMLFHRFYQQSSRSDLNSGDSQTSLRAFCLQCPWKRL